MERSRSRARRQASRGRFGVVTAVVVLVAAWTIVAAPGSGAVAPGPGPIGGSLVSASTSGDTLSLVFECHGGLPTEMCSGQIRLTSHVKTVGSGSYAVRTGLRGMVRITLDATGRSLLLRSYRLPATLRVSGTIALSRKVVFRYARITSPISYTWMFGSYTVAQQLTVSRVPPGGMVEVICHGGGCPFARRGFSPVRGRVVLAPVFKSSRLRPGARLVLQVTAANRVGKVATFTIHFGAPPSLSESCLPPGAKRPTRCA